jgi:hypothetical protein
VQQELLALLETREQQAAKDRLDLVLLGLPVLRVLPEPVSQVLLAWLETRELQELPVLKVLQDFKA